MTRVIFNTPFTGKTFWNDGFSGQDWYEVRSMVFTEFTLKSLMNQSDKDFVWWIQFRPEEKENPITKNIERALKESGINYVMTFHGPMIMEDQATWHNDDIFERAKKSIPFIEPYVKGCDYIYETNLDSDDLVHRDFVKNVKAEPFRQNGAVYCRKGYIYELGGKVAEWYNPKANQNYTIMYPKGTYLDPKMKYLYQNGLRTHEEVPTLFNATEIKGRMYCSLAHDTNVSTIWGHPFRKRMVNKRILKDFI